MKFKAIKVLVVATALSVGASTGNMPPNATLKKVYQFDPYEGVESAARKNVVGGQCCNWSTHTFCLEKV